MSPSLQPDLNILLARLVEIDNGTYAMFVPRISARTRQVHLRQPAADEDEAFPLDPLNELAGRGYLDMDTEPGKRIGNFRITEAGRETVRGAADTFEAVETLMLRGLDDRVFRDRHPDAYADWQHAARLAAEDPAGHATRIGHDCREAMQLFATSAMHDAGITVEAGPTDTVKKIRSVLDARREDNPEKLSAFLDALLTFWGTVSDLAQRQEHGAQKEGEPLTAADGTRLALQTAVVMFEIDRTLATP